MTVGFLLHVIPAKAGIQKTMRKKQIKKWM